MLQHEIRKIREHADLPEAEHLRLKQEKALELIKFSRRHSSFYRNYYKPFNADLPFEEFYEALPIIRKTDILANRNAMCTTAPFLLKEGQTSGTSGTPLSVYRSPGSIIRENAYLWYFRMMHGLNIGDPVISMRGKLDNSTLSYYNKAENILYLSVYLLSAQNIGKYAKLIREFQPKGMVSLPSSLYTMVNLLEQEEIDITVPTIITASSTLYPFQREKIERVLHTRVFDWYGNAERTIIMGQCKHGNYHEFPMYSLCDFKTEGVVTTALTNRAFPLIKYYVDDKFTLLDGACPCGKTKAVRSVEGRFEDAIVLADGRLINGLGIGFQGIKHLRYAQIIQDKVNEITVNLVTAPGFSKQDEETILKRLRQRMDDTVLITFRQVQEHDIIKTPSGKFTLIISRLHNTKLPDQFRTFENSHTAVA